MLTAQSVMEQLPLWGRLVISFVIFFGFFGVVLVATVLGLRPVHHSTPHADDDDDSESW